jgi:hypothetical protein
MLDHHDNFAHPLPLAYRGPGIEPPQRQRPYYPLVAQFVVGFLAALLGEFLWASLAFGLSEGQPAVALISGLVLAVGVGWLGISLHVCHGWRGFLPGLLIALTLTCVLPGAFVFVMV